MRNRNFIWLAVGIILLALVITGVYWPKASRDEQNPKPVVIKNVASGTVVLPETMTQLSVDGPDGLVSVELDKGIGKLPIGHYRIGSWRVEKGDDQGNTWVLAGRHYGSEGSFEVTDDSRINLDIGEPIVAVVHGSQVGPKNYSFGQSLQGRLEENITLVRNGAKPGAPRLRITNNDGTYDRTFAFQYG